MKHPRCHCQKDHCEPKLIVITGGPGAGKTATLEVLRRHFCDHVEVLPEAATLLYRGGFPRSASLVTSACAQRAIFTVQRELERIALLERHPAIVLCDRGTLDGLAYWRGSEASFFENTGTSREKELARYAMVIHLRTPDANGGYVQTNPMRIESAIEARVIDESLVSAWRDHPRRIEIAATADFLAKIERVVELIREECPSCCRVAGRATAGDLEVHRPDAASGVSGVS